MQLNYKDKFVPPTMTEGELNKRRSNRSPPKSSNSRSTRGLKQEEAIDMEAAPTDTGKRIKVVSYQRYIITCRGTSSKVSG